MPLIGNPITASFQARPATEEFNGNGSTTTFTLGHTVTQEDIIVSVDGVIQESVDAFTVPDGTTLTFTAAPSSGTGNIFVIYMGVSAASVTPAAENKGNFKAGGIFRTNAPENANVTGPLTVASGVTLTVESGGTLVTL
jgi:hypothetical protein